MPDLAQATPSHYIENKSNNILITVCHTMQQSLTKEAGEVGIWGRTRLKNKKN